MAGGASELVAQLAKAGTPPELLAAVAKELFAAETEREALASRRKNERERKARSRDGTGQGVTGGDKESVPRTPLKESAPLNGSLKGEPIPPRIELKPEHVVEAWNDMAERLGLAKVKRLSDQRMRKLKVRMREHSIEDFTEAISAIERSPFLRGDGRNGWRADFDFLLQPSSFQKLIEGSYDRSH